LLITFGVTLVILIIHFSFKNDELLIWQTADSCTSTDYYNVLLESTAVMGMVDLSTRL